MPGEAGPQVFGGQIDDFRKPHVVTFNQNLEDGRIFEEATNDTAMIGRYVLVASFRIGLLHHCRQFGEFLKDVYIDNRG